jgi:Rad3-related DNA helicase
MTTTVVRGVPVSFPYTPYPCQVDYMTKVIEALDGGTNALLESPTGTGKTLSLLCATLAWQIQQRARQLTASGAAAALQYSDAPLLHQQQRQMPQAQCTIVYASRTHSQLSQVARELKASVYRPKLALLGSREQLCVHSEVSKLKGTAMSAACGTLCKSRSCKHHTALDQGAGPEADRVMDIEELAELGRSTGFCPYYHGRNSAGEAELILMPYNYLLDAASRRSLKVAWPGAVVIFDEAHNLEGVASDSASFELTSYDVAAAISEVQKCLTAVRKGDSSGSSSSSADAAAGSSAAGFAGGGLQAQIDMFRGLLLVLKGLEDTLDSVKLPSDKDKGVSEKVHPAVTIYYMVYAACYCYYCCSVADTVNSSVTDTKVLSAGTQSATSCCVQTAGRIVASLLLVQCTQLVTVVLDIAYAVLAASQRTLTAVALCCHTLFADW